MTQPLPLTPPAFEAALRAKGAYYHIHHPYHIAMHNGEATREQIRGWVANRFYYQTSIPIKDAAIMANCPQPETRRKWVQRIRITMATAAAKAALKPGCARAKPSGCSATPCSLKSWCYRACALRSTPTSISRAAPAGKKRPAAR